MALLQHGHPQAVHPLLLRLLQQPPHRSPCIHVPLPPALSCSPPGSLSNLYKREGRCAQSPPITPTTHTTKSMLLTSACQPLRYPPLLDLTANSATLASLMGPENPKLIWTLGPLHFPYPLPVLFFPPPSQAWPTFISQILPSPESLC